LAPVAVLYLPRPQRVQDVMPLDAVYLPGSQSAQLDAAGAPAVLENLPARHWVHVLTFEAPSAVE
jgi:hypothetical protein